MESTLSIEDEKDKVTKQAHKTNITKLLKSYDLFKVKVKFGFEKEIKDTLEKKSSNIKAYLGKFSRSGKHGKQKVSEKESMQTIIHSTSNPQQPTINHFPKTNKAKIASRNVISDLQFYFKPLDDLSQGFTCYLWELTRNIFNLASNGHAKTVIKCLSRIIWLEEEIDAQKNEARIVKSYKNKFFSNLSSIILERFELFLSKAKDAPLTLLDKLDFIYNDLSLVKDEIEPQFPSHYNIRLFFVQGYHDQVYTWLNNVIQTDMALDAGTIFDLIRWVRQYYLKIVSDMHVSQDLLEPQLLDGREQELIDYFLSIMRNKFQEWKNNLIGSDIKEFIERPYELDANKVTGLSGTPVLISMINQQIDLAIMSIHEKILVDVIKECCKVMTDIQQTWIITLESEVRLYIEERGEPRLLEYIVALANDECLCADHIENLKTRLAPLFKSNEHWDSVNAELCYVRDGFLYVVTNAINYSVLKTSYGDIPRKFLKNILSRRYDLITSRSINKIIKSKEIEYGEYTGEPTIFNMIKIEDEDVSGEQFKGELDRFKGEVQQLTNG
ncbi:8637_t:CDS:2, partial [Racocetra fulgida]